MTGWSSSWPCSDPSRRISRRLLRTTEEWVAEQELGSIDFEVDGRRYTLRTESPERALAAVR